MSVLSVMFAVSFFSILSDMSVLSDLSVLEVLSVISLLSLFPVISDMSVTLRSLLSVQYAKQFRPPILRTYCTLNRVLSEILKTIHLIETYTFTFQP